MTFTCKECGVRVPQGEDEYRFWKAIVEHYETEHPEAVARARPRMRTLEDAQAYLRGRTW